MRIPRLRMLAVVASAAFASTFVLGVMGGGGTALGAATTITVLAGEVSVKQQSDTAYVAAVDGSTLRAGATVRTGAGARAVITYFEGSTVTLESDTVLVVDAADSRDGGTVVLMTQLAGRTWHVVTKLVNAQSRYEVRTPASTASVRGTRFVVDARPDRTTITTEEGKVVVAVASGADVIEVPVAAGMTQTQQRGDVPSPAHASGSVEKGGSLRATTLAAPDEKGFVQTTARRAETTRILESQRRDDHERATDRRGADEKRALPATRAGEERERTDRGRALQPATRAKDEREDADRKRALQPATRAKDDREDADRKRALQPATRAGEERERTDRTRREARDANDHRDDRR